MERTGDSFQADMLVWRAQAAIARDEPAVAMRLLRKAQLLVSGTGEYLAVDLGRTLAEVLLMQDRTSEVGEAVSLARTAAEQYQIPSVQASAWIAEAFGAAAEGDEDTARRHFSQAIPLLETQERALDELGEARLAYARLLERFADRTGAEDQLDKARETFEKVGALASVAYIDRELARLRDIEVMRPTASGDVVQLRPRTEDAPR
jgi:ATP/maltotriose-dependent transcriptional regulator MalT